MASSKGFLSLFRRSKAKTVKAEVPSQLGDLFAQEAMEPERKDAGGLPRFKTTAADQIDRRRSDRFTAMRMRLRSAFTPSQPVVDRRMFAGREAVLRAMISSIEDQRLHLVLYGERGIGKTSLLHVLSEAAREARYIVIYSSCGAASNFEETFRGVAAEIPLLFHTGFGPTTEEAETGSTLADLLPPNFSPRQFADLCMKLTGTRVLIVLDEFDRCGTVEFRRDLAELIKFLSDRSVRIQVVIGGVAADLTELVEHIPSIRRNILAMRVPRMTEDEIRQLVGTGEKASGLQFDPDAQEMIVTLTRGWPYIASLLCHHSGLQAIEAGRATVTPGDVSAAVDDALIELRARMGKSVLTQLDRLLSENVGKLLSVLAGASLAAGGDFDTHDIDDAAQKPSEGTAARRLAEQLASEKVLLEQREDSHGRRYAFSEEGLPPYLWFMGVQESFGARAVAAQRASNG